MFVARSQYVSFEAVKARYFLLNCRVNTGLIDDMLIFVCVFTYCDMRKWPLWKGPMQERFLINDFLVKEYLQGGTVEWG